MDPVKVLVVDDDDSVRTIIRISLAVEPGIGEVREASDGAGAIDVCADFRPDVVILDYWMPHMDGERTSALIRGVHPEARIVAYSAVLERKPSWADAYLVKDSLPEPAYLIDLARLEREASSPE